MTTKDEMVELAKIALAILILGGLPALMCIGIIVLTIRAVLWAVGVTL